MLKKTYKILKYIYKNPNISKSELEKKFSDFEKYQSCISSYVSVKDTNKDIEEETRSKLNLECQKLGLKIVESAEYVSKHMANVQNITDDSLIFYSTNLTFDEYYEKRKHDTWLFWFPYTITTLIAIASLLDQIFK